MRGEPAGPGLDRTRYPNLEAKRLVIRLSALEGDGESPAEASSMEFHVKRAVREELGIDDFLFALSGNCVLPNFLSSRMLAQRLNETASGAPRPDHAVKAGQVNAMGLIDEILHYVCSLYRKAHGDGVFARALAAIEASVGKKGTDGLLLAFVHDFPPMDVYKRKIGEAAYLRGRTAGRDNREIVLEEALMLWLANDNPAFSPFARLFDDAELRSATGYAEAVAALRSFFKAEPGFGPDGDSLVELLKSPAIAVPDSLPGQLDYIRKRWGLFIGDYLTKILSSLDLVKEEEKAFFPGPGPTRVLAYEGLEREYERFSMDKDWMPRTVMIAKSTLVWLQQLSRTYERPISRLDEIPDEELDSLASRGFTALWLIGIWERSKASERIKKACGNPEAAASAYSLYDYEIAGELGGWGALAKLRERAGYRGIRLATDMVPNHTGMESKWMRERPDYFIQTRTCPFPAYSFSGANLSSDPDIGIFLEDRYYSRTDAAVVFKRVDFRTGDVRYVYHGNDGTSMPWNDTAQIDYLNLEAREAVKATILNVARNFPIIRFDAAMVLAKKHVRRLWYPEPGAGGDIPSRAEHAMSREDFDRALPEEFWREVVDMCAAEAPDALLLAEAFWMLEGYFVRTLGMHRVYNSAFMNMLKREENEKYRATIKNTVEFDPEILKRFVNFLNNPDEETAAAQFGKGDKYFGVCSMMVTMPGLPMFGHGQVEGFEEKYGMEYRRAYWNETEDGKFVQRHEREIFPLMKKRYLFSSAADFLLFDLRSEDGSVNENVFAYSNRYGNERALVLYNNAFPKAWGRISESAPYLDKSTGDEKGLKRRSLAQGLGVSGEAGRFCLFREQRSGFWFIRDSEDMARRGLFVALDGYQCQVFLDVGEIDDNQLGQYRKLCDILNGAGVLDVSSAMQDIFLKDLYDALGALASEEFFRVMRVLLAPAAGIASGKRKPSVAKVSASLEKPFKALFRTALRFLEGTSEYDAFTLRKKTRVATEEAAFTSFRAGLEDLAALAEAIGSRASPGLAWMSDYFRSKAESMDFASAFLLMTQFRSALGHGADFAELGRLIDHWRVDRKLAERLEAAGSERAMAEQAMSAMRIMISRIDVPPRDRGVGDTGRASSLIGLFGADEDIRSRIGVHEYGGRVWFVKESFEEFLWYAFIAYSMYYVERPLPSGGRKLATGPMDGPSRLKRIAANGAILEALLEAEAESGFDFGRLAEILALKSGKSSVRPAVKSPPARKKAASTKAPEVATAGKKTLSRKATEKKTLPRKAPARKVPVKKTPSKARAAGKVPVKKTPAKKTPVKKAVKKKVPIKKVPERIKRKG
jgi:glycosidase